MTQMAADWPMVFDAIKVAKKHRDRHNQGTWFNGASSQKITARKRLPECGTAACLAGFIVLRNAPVGTVLLGGETDASGMVKLPDGRTVWMDEYAKVLADLDTEQVSRLFYADDLDIDEVEDVAKGLRADG